MSIHCIYGVGRETEETYYYKKNEGEIESKDIPFSIDTSINDPKNSVYGGIKFGDGDSTVPLVSLGYMCRGAWKTPEFNPSNMKVITREYVERSDERQNKNEERSDTIIAPRRLVPRSTPRTKA